MGKKKPKASKQSSPVTGSSKDQFGPDRKPDGSKENMEGGGAQCEDTSVTHPGKSDVPHTGETTELSQEAKEAAGHNKTLRPESALHSCVTMKNDQVMDDPGNMSSTSTQTNARSKDNMEGGGALCEDTSVTHPGKSDHPDVKDKLDDHHTCGYANEESRPSANDLSDNQQLNDSGYADSAVWSEASMPRDINFPGPQPHKSKDNMEGGGALCEDTSVTHPVKSDDPDIKDKLDDHHTSDSGYADSAVCSEESMTSAKDNQQQEKHTERTATNSHGQPDRMSLCSDQSRSIGPGFSEDNIDESLIPEENKICKESCEICLGNIQNAVKHCKTCNVSFCETHVTEHYKSPAYHPHQLVEYKQTSRESPATEHSLQRSSSDPVENLELRVMMLGMTGSGMSTSGNTILGREAFKSEASALPVTKRCDSQSGVVYGQLITVIDTPAIPTRMAERLSEKEDPGPHVFLLVIPLRRFTEEDGKEVKWIQSYFGEEALKFTIILFTGGDQLKGKPFEDFLEESSKLQTLLDSVQGRYHVFDNSHPEERLQVYGLIKKIQKVLISKLGYDYTHEERQKVKTDVRREYEREKENAERTRDQELEKVKMAARQEYKREKEIAERTRIQELEKVKTDVRQEYEKEKAERTRNQEEKNMRDNQAYKAGIWKMVIILSVLTALALRFHHYPEDPVYMPELRVMMLGQTGAGKSASGNTILGREAFKSEASALPVTKSCDIQSGVVEGRNITVIDTPAITSRRASWLSEKVGAGPHVFLLVIPLGRFTEEDGQEVKWIQSNFGEEALKFTIILFTGGDQMDHKNAEQFLKESSGLQTLVRSTGGGDHIFDNKTPRGHGQVKGLLEKIELLLRKNTGYSYSHGLHEHVKTAVREEEERKRLNQEQGQHMEKRIEQKIREQMELKIISRIENATATLNEFREVVKATTEQSGNYILEQVTTAVREEEEMKKREEEEDKRKRLKMEIDIQISQVIKNREKRIEREIREQMKSKMITRIANATATLNELREVVKTTKERIGNCLQEQVKAAEREVEERKRREEEEEEKRRGRGIQDDLGGSILNFRPFVLLRDMFGFILHLLEVLVSNFCIIVLWGFSSLYDLLVKCFWGINFILFSLPWEVLNYFKQFL